jgi:hypothetical protein
VPRTALDARLFQLERQLERIDGVVQRQARELEIQFKRIAQLQAETDEMRAASANAAEFLSTRKR